MIRLSIILLVLSSITIKAQTKEGDLSKYIDNIVKGIEPKGEGVTIHFEKDYRVISFRDDLIKKYRYSDEALDKLGFKYTSNEEEFKLCSKNIILSRYKYEGHCIIRLSWYSDAVKNSTILMWCKYK